MFDFIKELDGSRSYTFHSHTEFCDGRAQMEAFAREAVKRRFTHYGFSPHSPIPFVSPCNMTRSHVDDYNREFDRILANHGDQCRFYRSMEVDYLGDDWNAANDYFHSLGLDYIISSVHFIPAQGGEIIDIDGRFESFQQKMKMFFHDDIRYVVEKFYELSCRMVETGGFDVIGHLDKIGHNASMYSPGIENEDWYVALLNDLINRIVASGITVEINTKAYKDHGRMFPAVAHWKRLKEAGVPLIVNSDAHVPVLIDASRAEAFEILDQL